MGGLSPLHLILILGIALIIIGPGKLPETGAALGKAVRSFRDAVDGSMNEAQLAPPATSQPPLPASPAEPMAAAEQPAEGSDGPLA